ncbi:hypothetical protein JHK84_027520 [Glycine max]|nr:hypothetical protein JHK84_027520 [Glycine max]
MAKLRAKDLNNSRKPKKTQLLRNLIRFARIRKEADHCVKMAKLIEYNLEDVDSAILAVRVALAKGIN